MCVMMGFYQNRSRSKQESGLLDMTVGLGLKPQFKLHQESLAAFDFHQSSANS